MVDGPGAQAKTTLSLSYKLVNYLTVSAEWVKTFVASNKCIFTVYTCAILKAEFWTNKSLANIIKGVK